jgi:hypothetical protein
MDGHHLQKSSGHRAVTTHSSQEPACAGLMFLTACPHLIWRQDKSIAHIVWLHNLMPLQADYSELAILHLRRV